jgi:negative regulator of flagellin synthesis FlgM
MKIGKPTISDSITKVNNRKKTDATDGQSGKFKNELSKARGDQAPAAAQPNMPASMAGLKASMVSLSLSNQAMEEATKLAAQTPEVREKLVAELKSKIDRGEYKVDPKKVAEKMVDRGFVKILITPI